jgi:hypothetical protein
MADEVKLFGAYVEIRAKKDELKKDFDRLPHDAKRVAKSIESSFRKHKMDMDNRLMTMKLSQVQQLHRALTQQLQNKIKLNTDIASIEKTRIALRSVEGALQGIEKQVDKPNVEVGQKLFNLAILSAAAFTLAKIGKEIYNISLAGAQFENLRKNFSGTAADIESFRQATAGTVDDAGLLRLSNQATDLGASLRQQALLFALAENAGDKYGTGVEEGFHRIIAATEGNIRGLKTLGIQKEVYERTVKDLAKAHGFEIDMLDAETQKQIRLEAVIKASGITMADVSGKIQDNADKIESATAEWRNFKEVIGELIGPGTASLLHNFTEGLKRLLGLTDDTQIAINKNKGLIQSSFLESLTGTDEAYRKQLYDDLTAKLKEIKAENESIRKQFVDIRLPSERKPLYAQINKNRIDYSVYDTQRKALLQFNKQAAEDALKTTQGLTEEQLKYLKEKAEERAKIEKELYDELTFISTEYESYRKKLIDDRVKKFREQGLAEVEIQKFINSELEKLAEEKKKFFNPEDINWDSVLFEMSKGANEPDKILDESIDENVLNEQNKKIQESIKTLEDLRLRAVDNEFERRKAAIELEYENLLIQFADSETMKAEIEKARMSELSQLQSDLYGQAFNEIQNIGSTLQSAFDIAGDTFLGRLFQALNVAVQIASVINSISTISSIFSTIASIGSIAAAPVTGGASVAAGGAGGIISGMIEQLAGGGDVRPYQTYIVGEKGPELFSSATAGTIIPNNALSGIGTSNQKINELINVTKGQTLTMVNLLREFANSNNTPAIYIDGIKISKQIMRKSGAIEKSGLVIDDKTV